MQGVVVKSLGFFLTHPALLVGVGGGVGSVARYYLGQFFNPAESGRVPWGTFAVNVAGSFVLGLLALIVLEKLPEAYRPIYVLLGVGFCGGFTTFSTFEWELFKLLRDGSWGTALAYLAGSVVAGFVGILAAAVIARLFAARA